MQVSRVAVAVCGRVRNTLVSAGNLPCAAAGLFWTQVLKMALKIDEIILWATQVVLILHIVGQTADGHGRFAGFPVMIWP